MENYESTLRDKLTEAGIKPGDIDHLVGVVNDAAAKLAEIDAPEVTCPALFVERTTPTEELVEDVALGFDRIDDDEVSISVFELSDSDDELVVVSLTLKQAQAAYEALGKVITSVPDFTMGTIRVDSSVGKENVAA